MRVLVVPAARDACAFYRLLSPARVLGTAGYDTQVHAEDQTWSAIWEDEVYRVGRETTRRARLVDLLTPPDADVVVLQRVMRAHHVELIRQLQQHGIAVVVDIDDDMHTLPDSNPVWRAAHPYWHKLHHAATGQARWVYDRSRPAAQGSHLLAEACRLADLVTVTTPALADRYARHGRVAILPNLVPSWYLEVGRDVRDSSTCRDEQPDAADGGVGPRLPDAPPDISPVIGWSGTLETHAGDLEVTRGAVAKVIAQTGARFHHIGTGKGIADALRLGPELVTAVGEWVDLDRYPRELAWLDIGIVPLARTKFNAAKSALKASEMAALGVPVVMSPTPDNRRLHSLGVGLLAHDRPAWTRQLRILAREPLYRLELAIQGREAMRQQTYEQRAEDWWMAWMQARINHHRRAQEAA